MFQLARECRGLSKTQLSKMTNVSVRHISDLENGRGVMTQEIISSFSKALNFPEPFFYREGQKVPLNPIYYRRFMRRDKLEIIKTTSMKLRGGTGHMYLAQDKI